MEKIKTIKLPTSKGYEFVPMDKVIYVQGDRNYSKFYTSNGEYHTAKTLGKIQEEYRNEFSRIHKSFLVNPNYVNKLTREQGKYWVLIKELNLKLPVSTTYKYLLTNHIEK